MWRVGGECKHFTHVPQCKYGLWSLASMLCLNARADKYGIRNKRKAAFKEQTKCTMACVIRNVFCRKRVVR